LSVTPICSTPTRPVLSHSFFLFFSRSPPPRHPPSFPTRRSSDLSPPRGIFSAARTHRVRSTCPQQDRTVLETSITCVPHPFFPQPFFCRRRPCSGASSGADLLLRQPGRDQCCVR